MLILPSVLDALLDELLISKANYAQSTARANCEPARLHVCMYVCMHAGMYLCMYVCACTCAYDDLFDASQTCINQSTNTELQFDARTQNFNVSARVMLTPPFLCSSSLNMFAACWKTQKDALTTMLQVSVQNPAYYTGTPAYYTGLTLYLSRRPFGKCSKLVRNVH